MIGLLPGSTIEVELSRRGIAEDLAGIPARGAMRTAVEASLADYAEPYAGAKARLLNVLEIMLLAYSSGVLHQNAQRLLKTLDL